MAGRVPINQGVPHQGATTNKNEIAAMLKTKQEHPMSMWLKSYLIGKICDL